MKNYVKVLAALCLGFTLVCGWGNPVWAALHGAQVAIYNDSGVWADGKTALESMMTWAGITYEEITASDLNSSSTNLSSLYKTIIIPGGDAGYYNGAYGNADYINATGKANIRNFVNNDGGYLGICAGAYFASDNVYYSLDGGASYQYLGGYTLDLWSGTASGPMNDIATYNADTSVYNYTMATLNFTSGNNVLSGYSSEDLLYFGGSTFSNYGTDTTVLATYENNNVLGTNSPAIVASTYGSGKVVLFGPHPEIEEDSSRDGVTTSGLKSWNGTTDNYAMDANDTKWYLLKDVLAYLGSSSSTTPSGGYSRYDFTYNYTDGSNDYYTGYVYAPTGFLVVGQTLAYEPAELGGGGMNGYYYITGATSGYDSSYDKEEYITSYYDRATQNTLEVNYTSSLPSGYVDGHIKVKSRSYHDESGYAYYNSTYYLFNPTTSVSY